MLLAKIQLWFFFNLLIKAVSIQVCPQQIAACLAKGHTWPLLHFELLLIPAGNAMQSLKPTKPISAKTQYSQFSMVAESVKSAGLIFSWKYWTTFKRSVLYLAASSERLWQAVFVRLSALSPFPLQCTEAQQKGREAEYTSLTRRQEKQKQVSISLIKTKRVRD